VQARRAGLATAAARPGTPERVIAEQTGDKSVLHLRKYVREGGLFEENAAAGPLWPADEVVSNQPRAA
jgi:hypothetical protein